MREGRFGEKGWAKNEREKMRFVGFGENERGDGIEGWERNG